MLEDDERFQIFQDMFKKKKDEIANNLSNFGNDLCILDDHITMLKEGMKIATNMKKQNNKIIERYNSIALKDLDLSDIENELLQASEKLSKVSHNLFTKYPK